MSIDTLRSLPFETQIFIGAILLVAGMLHLRFNVRAVANGPTILTTLGIFATFLGIAIGLANFNSANIQDSIPQLLDGLKTAFWASVVGVGCALTVKFRDHLWGHAQDSLSATGQEDVGALEIVQSLGKIEHALVGGEEGSLISQLKFLRTETRDELRQLREAQTKALEKLSEMGSKALIEALKDVIRDFNEKLTEQFGENFKQLNTAVEKLVIWQDQYRVHVEASTERLTEIQKILAKATADYSLVVEKSEIFAKVSSDLGLVLSDMQVRQDELRKQSSALAELLLQASGSLPEVEAKMVDLARQLADGLRENQQLIEAALKAHLKTIQDGAHQTGESIKLSAQELSQAISRNTEVAQQELIGITKDLAKAAGDAQMSMSKSMGDGAESLRQSMRSTIEGMSAANTEHNKQLSELVSKTRENVTLLDKALGEELERSLQSLGRQLTALSEKFVADYLPLTESLRRVVEIGRRAGVQ